jgi:tumor protein p53-inducible protein 3
MGGTAFVTAGSKEKIDNAIKLGAKAGYVDIIYTHSPTQTHTHTTHRWNYKTEDWGKAMEGKANVILDCVGGSHAPRNVQSLAMDSRWVLFGLMGGRDAPGEGKGLLGSLLRKRASIRASTLRTRSHEYKEVLTKRFAAEVMPFFVKGKLKVVIDSKFNFDKIKDAYDRLLANKNIGKILVVGINGSS